jgi:hypothetical protein
MISLTKGREMEETSSADRGGDSLMDRLVVRICNGWSWRLGVAV